MNRSLKMIVALGWLAVSFIASSTLFVNCTSSVEFGGGGTMKLSSGGGNADGYDGKPDPGTYYRVVPDLRCGSTPSVFGEMTVDASGATVKTLDPKSCATITTNLSLGSLEQSALNRAVVGYGEGIFEKRDAPPSVDERSELVVETWCRLEGSAPDSGVDVVVRVDAANERASSTLFVNTKDANGNAITDRPAPVAVTRSLQRTSLGYHSDSFELSLDLAALATGAIKVPGTLRAKVADRSISGAVTCRTGGLLDQNRPVPPMSCPVGYARVPALAGYAPSDFCVAKYESKASGTSAASVPVGLPWIGASVAQSLSACRANGTSYDLISNLEWQAVARDVENVASNWSGGIVGGGSLNRGHSDGAPASYLAASEDDNDACFGTNDTCSASAWNPQRRTHLLSTGQVVWDLGGNATEWTKDANSTRYGPDSLVSELTNAAPFAAQTKDLFGPSGDYRGLPGEPYAGFGRAYLNFIGGTIARGGRYSSLGDSGIFFTDLNLNAGAGNTNLTFRCVYRP